MLGLITSSLTLGEGIKGTSVGKEGPCQAVVGGGGSDPSAVLRQV